MRSSRLGSMGGMRMATIGFIGLGNMGAPMAANLVKAGHQVTGFDLVPAAVEVTVAKVAGVPNRLPRRPARVRS